MPESKPLLGKIALATTPEQIGRCSSVMRELRPHIEAIDFAARVLQQQKEGYQLARTLFVIGIAHPPNST
jgi:hypothetical protein